LASVDSLVVCADTKLLVEAEQKERSNGEEKWGYEMPRKARRVEKTRRSSSVVEDDRLT
jgi:hypothetical protein